MGREGSIVQRCAARAFFRFCSARIQDFEGCGVSTPIKPFALSPKDAAAYGRLGLTRIKALLRSGALPYRKAGKRALILRSDMSVICSRSEQAAPICPATKSESLYTGAMRDLKGARPDAVSTASSLEIPSTLASRSIQLLHPLPAIKHASTYCPSTAPPASARSRSETASSSRGSAPR
jgi:hypothetical protein